MPAPRPLQSLHPQQQSVAVPRWPSVHVEKPSVTTASRATSSAVLSCTVAGTCEIDTDSMEKEIHTSVACNDASFFKSSEPRLTIARVVSVRSCLQNYSMSGRTLSPVLEMQLTVTS
jgi:hypothetical protein